MPRLIFPDEGSRLVFRMSGAGKPLLSAAAGIATIYADEAGTTLADIQTVAGETIISSTLTVSEASQLPLFLGPDFADTVWVSVDGGPIAPCYARVDDRVDALITNFGSTVRSVNGLVPDANGDLTLAPGGVADASSTTKGVLQLLGDLGGTAVAPTTPTAVHLTGVETINGVKTFNDPPVVPDGSFTVAKTTGLQAALDLKANLSVALNNQTGTTYTLVLADAGKVVQMANAAANTVTIPPNASVAYPVGTVIGVAQTGAGATSVAPGTGVTLTWNNGVAGSGVKALTGQHADVTLFKIATDSWRMSGALAP